MNVCVIGLGYVGLTLSLAMADSGLKVYGVDTNQKIISSLNNKIPPFSENGLYDLLQKCVRKNFHVYSEIPDVDFDYYVLAVGTPINNDKSPTMDSIRNASKTVGKKLKKNQTVILRSTVPVGTTRNHVIPILEKESNLKSGVDFSLAFAPERTIEGNAISEIHTNPQIIGGVDVISIQKTTSLFHKITKTTVPVSSLEIAEMIKLIDNTYRDVHFAYSNEIALICETLKINVHECIEKANFQYTRNNIPIPSPGVGGPCLSKDTYILAFSTKSSNYTPELIMRGRWVNEFVPVYLASKILTKLDNLKKTNPKILVLGFAFKGFPETDDTRNSSTILFVNKLKQKFENIFGYDPVVSFENIKNLGIKPIIDLDNGFESADCIAIMNNHKSYSSLPIEELLEKTSNQCIFVDPWNLFPQLSKHEKIIYTGIGIE